MKRQAIVRYEKFLEDIVFPKLSLYEKACQATEKLGLSPGIEVSAKIREAAKFCNLIVTPKGAFSLAVITPVLFAVFSLFPALLLGILNLTFFMLTILFSAIIFYYLYNMPFLVATSYRIKATGEMILAVIYMSIAMKVIPNIEYAVKFAAINLQGPLSKDLKKLLWDVYLEKYVSVFEALDDFLKKWKHESEEFTDAIYLLKTSFFEKVVDRDEVLNEAINLVINGTRERMQAYVRDLRTKVTILNAFGIMGPIIGLVFFALVEFILPEVVKPIILVVGYNIILPLLIYFLMKTNLEKRPISAHQIDLSKHPQFAGQKTKYIKLIAVLLPIAISIISYYQILQIQEIFSLDMLLYSLTITWAVSFGIIFYTLFTSIDKLATRKEIERIETEMNEVLYQLGFQLKRGIPIEIAIREILPKIRELNISKMFMKILYNMESLGMTFNNAIFDKDVGAINYFPSKFIEIVLKSISDISNQGIKVLSNATLSISNFLKNVHTIEEDLKDKLSEVSSLMDIQAIVLAPLTGGVVVALVAILMQIFITISGPPVLQGSFTSDTLTENSIFRGIIDLNAIIKVHNFQLIVGMYMIEVVLLIAVFSSIINYSEDILLMKYTVGKILLIATLVYTVSLILTFSSIGSLIPASSFVRA